MKRIVNFGSATCVALIAGALLTGACSTLPLVGYPAPPTRGVHQVAATVTRSPTPVATATWPASPTVTATRIASATAAATFTPGSAPTRVVTPDAAAPTLVPFNSLSWVRLEMARSSFEVPDSWYAVEGRPEHLEFYNIVPPLAPPSPEELGNGLITFSYGESRTTLEEIVNTAQTGLTISDFRALTISGYPAYLRETRPGDSGGPPGAWYFGLYVDRGDLFVTMSMNCFISPERPPGATQPFYDYCQAIEDHIINSLIVL